jgi:putative tryptophan/tyrosine transport system substrate-binding protein
VKRREFITLLGGTAVWPFAARAQQSAMPVIGLLQVGTPSSFSLSGFRQGLKEGGYVEGQNLVIEYRWANDDPSRLPELAADLVHHQVRLIVALGYGLAAQAAKAATNTIPVVFGYGGDPVGLGHVASLNRPGGNVTGITSLSNELFGKQLGILHELLPHAHHVAVLDTSTSLTHESIVKETQAAATAIGQTIEVLIANNNTDEIAAVFARVADEKRVQGLLVSNDPLFRTRRVQLAILAARYALPAIYPFREQVEAGGLLSYGPDLADRDRQVGHYVSLILNGANPADLPVLQSTKFEFVLNMQTAKALGLEVSPTLLSRADEVIE